VPDPFAVRAAGIDDAAAIADLVRRAFSTQSRPTNPPSGAHRHDGFSEPTWVTMERRLVLRDV
jgi:hypothetical protein